MTDHGTPARWPTCACKECDEAQRKAAHTARVVFQPKHGTADRWLICVCDECDAAYIKAGNKSRRTDRDRVAAFLETIPGDGADWWYAIVKTGADMLPRRPWTNNDFEQAIHERPDKTVDAKTWGHVRNIVDAARQLAFVLGAAERGDDPDIPF